MYPEIFQARLRLEKKSKERKRRMVVTVKEMCRLVVVLGGRGEKPARLSYLIVLMLEGQRLN